MKSNDIIIYNQFALNDETFNENPQKTTPTNFKY